MDISTVQHHCEVYADDSVYSHGIQVAWHYKFLQNNLFNISYTRNRFENGDDIKKHASNCVKVTAVNVGSQVIKCIGMNYNYQILSNLFIIRMFLTIIEF